MPRAEDWNNLVDAATRSISRRFIDQPSNGTATAFNLATLTGTLVSGGVAMAQPKKFDAATKTWIVDEAAATIAVYDATMTSGGFNAGTDVRYDEKDGEYFAAYPPCIIQME